ncbi:flavin reductase family protein [Marinagarivorans algicola]|uniref:flavin reductase family protein n=1 Tax=Marinagarivorans algicola TaxID=1513270 RepID=UPI0006B556CE|nr:flavin reductase family protein [Marinagarivorans algicola]
MSDVVPVPMDLADAMKKGMRQWASGVAVISTKDTSGLPHAMTASSLTSVTDNPPSLLVCVNKSARMAGMLTTETLFCANLLTEQQQSLSNACANPAEQDKRFDDASWDIQGTPRLTSASVSFECRVVNSVPQGTHNIVVGEIIAVHFNAQSTLPLCYWNGGYQRLNIAL